MDQKTILEEKNIIISQIKKHVPLFAKFFDADIPIKEYSANLYKFNVHQTHVERQALIRKNILAKLSQLYGNNFQNDLKVNLDGKQSFNIVDHHQVLNNPLLVGSNVIANVSKFFNSEKQDAIVVISSGDVPPNNYFSKNGFHFHGKQVPLFSTSERESSSYYLPKRDFNFLHRLKIAKRLHEFTKDELTYLEQLQKTFDSVDFSRAENYCDQISLIIRKTWPLLFEDKLRTNLPELLYITQEELTTNCLIDLLRNDNFISQCLFEPKLRHKVLDNFRGNVVAWREQENKGTHFFWHKHPNRPHSLRMYVQENRLVPTDERYKHLAVELNAETVIDLLQKKQIYPSLFLIFGVLNFYAGVKPLTGYGSVVYLQKLREAWIESLRDSSFSSEIPLIEGVDTSGFVGGVPIFFKRQGDKIKTLYATDIYEQGGISSSYLETIFNMPFNQLLSVAVADLYDYFSQKYVPTNERIKPKINFDDLAETSFDWV